MRQQRNTQVLNSVEPWAEQHNNVEEYDYVLHICGTDTHVLPRKIHAMQPSSRHRYRYSVLRST